MSAITEVHDNQSKAEIQEATKADTPTVLYFTAAWCGPCKVASPLYVKLAAAFPAAKYYKIDVDDANEIAAEYGISAMPTFIVYKSGKEVGQRVMGANIPALQVNLQSAL